MRKPPRPISKARRAEIVRQARRLCSLSRAQGRSVDEIQDQLIRALPGELAPGEARMHAEGWTPAFIREGIQALSAKDGFDASGCHESDIQHWLRAEVYPRDYLDRLCRLFRCHQSQLGWPSIGLNPPIDHRSSGHPGSSPTGSSGIELATRPATGVPDRIRPSDIEQICAAATELGRLDHTYGSGLLREAGSAQVKWSMSLLQSRCPPELRAALNGAVGQLGLVAGWMAFDAGLHRDASQTWNFALALVEESENWRLRCQILVNLARQAIRCEEADRGLTFADLALVRADRLTGRELAGAASVRAQALARLGRTDQSLHAIGEADHAFSRMADIRTDPGWSYYYAAEHQALTGGAFFELAMLGLIRPEEAEARLSAAVCGYTNEVGTRSRALAHVKLAMLAMVAGDPIEAAAMGQRAVDVALPVRSQRLVADLRQLTRLDRHAAIPEVDTLRRRIAVELALPGPMNV